MIHEAKIISRANLGKHIQIYRHVSPVHSRKQCPYIPVSAYNGQNPTVNTALCYTKSNLLTHQSCLITEYCTCTMWLGRGDLYFMLTSVAVY